MANIPFIRLPESENSTNELLKADLATFVEATLDPASYIKTERNTALPRSRINSCSFQ